MYKTRPVSTRIGKTPMNVCAFEWKVDKYIRLTGGPKEKICFDRQTESLEKSIDHLENDIGVCFYDHRNFDGFKLCSTFDHNWIGKDMNDEFSSVIISPNYCVKVFSNINYNQKPDRKKPSETRLIGVNINEKRISDLASIGWNDRISSYKVGKLVDGKCLLSQ